MPITTREFDRVINKLGFETREGKHRIAHLYVEGRLVLTTQRSHKSSGRELPHHLIRKQLRLTETQLQDAINCPLNRSGYLEVLKQKGLF